MLEVSGLEAAYGSSQVLFGMAFRIEAGEVVTLLGRNGMGKTTTVNALMGIVPPTAGTIQFEGASLAGKPPFRIAMAGLGLVPEGRQVFPNLTVLENLTATLANRRNVSDPWTLEKVFALFPGLQARRNSMGSQLSGGEQQMLAIGRALLTNPRLLILDEATEGLAPLIRAQIWRVLQQLKDASLSILVIDKNVQRLLAFADRHYIVEKGQVVWSGDTQAFRNATDVQHRYLGV